MLTVRTRLVVATVDKFDHSFKFVSFTRAPFVVHACIWLFARDVHPTPRDLVGTSIACAFADSREFESSCFFPIVESDSAAINCRARSFVL